ncbi:adenylate/guanylate cyclase domain-containing protein [Pelagibius sp. 7325]|uniref:CHASE2 domain-containing protein n=1 Tax=Pelagibius sp. 7325 TaxID=3131994 RepID=UPI0030ECBF7F
MLRVVGLSRALGLALLVPVLVLRVWDPAPLEALRLKIFDLYQTAMPREPLEQQPVVIVDIDEESLVEIGQWPWPRTEVARLIDRLRSSGVAATAFDVVFAEPDRTSPGRYANYLGHLPPDLLDAMRNLPSNDELMALALRRTPVVLGQAGYHRKLGAAGNFERSQVPLAVIGPDPKPYLFRFPALVRNIAMLERSAAGTAIFNLVSGRDGVVRHMPAFIVADDQIRPSLAVELLRIATGGNAVLIKTDAAGMRSFVVAGIEVPTDRNGRLWVHYATPRPQLYVSAKDLLSGAVGPERMAGKLALVGTSAAGLFDIKATPLQDRVPGVEVHAQVLEMILSGQLLLRPNYALGAELSILAVIGLLLIVMVPLIGAVLTLLLGAVVAGGLVAGSWHLFVNEGLLIDVAYPLAGSFSVFVLLIFTNYLREENRRQRVRGAFSQYLSPTLVDQLANDPNRLVLGGEKREMTILFSDVRGFTQISEGLQDSPEELTRLMNRLLTPLTEVIMSNAGTIDKYMGDAIMAFWNAPLSDAAHVDHACWAALAMQQALEDLNRELAAEASAGLADIDQLNIGIGINTGLCVVGNMGSRQRFDYSVLGDVVNLASRLEGQSPIYGADIVLGEATATALDGAGVCTQLDLIRVKGKREPQHIYALLGTSDLVKDPGVRAAMAAVDSMLAAYRARDWPRAEEMLDALGDYHLARLNLRVFVRLYRQRIVEFAAHPPPPDWEGVYVATTK